MPAPIAIFAYRRPDHLSRLINSLVKNTEFIESKVFFFCDGARNNEDTEGVRQTRELIRSYNFSNAVLVESEKNKGLANSIISGTSDLCSKYGEAIILEDDLVLSPHFLSYMNQALEFYRDDNRVMQVSGYMFPVHLRNDKDAIVLPFTTTWGWATWNRAWKHFDRSMSGYEVLKKDKELRHKFDFFGAFPYFKRIEWQQQGKTDSWGIAWYLNVFNKDGLVVHPGKTLVVHAGIDGTGTHIRIKERERDDLDINWKVERFPSVEIDQDSFSKIQGYLRKEYSMPGRIRKYLANNLFNLHKR